MDSELAYAFKDLCPGIILECENCGKLQSISGWLALNGFSWSGEVRAFCGEKCKREWWAKQPVFDMGEE